LDTGVTATQAKPRRALSQTDRWILVTHALIAISVGVFGVLSASDDGWADLQRIAIVMFTVIWLALLAASAVIARFVNNTFARAAVLLGAPVGALIAVVLAVR
jgi:hypothetical protein